MSADRAEQASFISPEIQTPVNNYHTSEIGRLSLKWTNCEIIRFADPDEDHLLYYDSDITHRLSVPSKFAEDLVNAGYPNSYYATPELYKYWAEDDSLKTESPELEVLLDGEVYGINHYSARMRRFMDVPEIDHIELWIPRSNNIAQARRFLAARHVKVLKQMFWQDFPQLTLPTIKMDPESYEWYVGDEREAA
jgi:hypothetical protein